MTASEREIDALLVHDRFVRSLAHSLVADAATADDVAQDAWLAGLKGGVTGLASFPRWVSGTVRNLADRSRRGARRRAEREERAARSERVPSAAEVLERESVRERLVAAVLALDEPYRATLLLRYFEGLSAREIARDHDLSLETVRTREKRALELLRTRLDREYGGDGRAWGAALLPFARLAAPSLTPLGVLAMTLQTKLAVGVAIAAVAAVWFAARGGSSSSGAVAEPVPVVAVLAPPAEPVSELGSPEPADARVALAPTRAGEEHVTAEPSGSLLVRVTWSDHTPASGIQARVEAAWSSGDPSWNAPEAITDAAGEFRLEHLALGKASVQLDHEGGGWAEIEDGKETTFEIQLERGFDVVGVVRDPAGSPVSGAEVWLSYRHSYEAGFVVTQSGADGRFFVRSCSGGTFGARAPRFAPSLLQSVRAAEGAQVALELVLMGPGGELAGTVFDPEGRPVPSAWVCAGDFLPRQVSAVPVGGDHALTGMRPFGQETRTDAEGRYRVRGLAPGMCPLVVRAEGFGLARAEAEILADQSSSFDVHLAPGVRLEGRVVDGEGNPLAADLRVDLGDLERVFGSQTTTDADGVFVLEDLAPGEFEVQAESRNRHARTKLSGAAGDIVRWDVVLGELGAIRGRLVDEHGAGLAGWFVEVLDEGPPAADHCTTIRPWRTDAEGRFVAEGLGNHRHRLEAYPPDGPDLFSPAVATGVFPEHEDVLLRVDPTLLPSVRIVGSVLDQDGQPVPSAQIRLTNLAFGQSTTGSPGIDGSFDLGPYPSGAWSLAVRAGERADCPELSVGPHELVAGDTWDCGALVLRPGGTLRVRTSGATGLAPLLVVLQGTARRGGLHAEGDALRSDPLAPGSYRLAVRGPGVVAALVPFEIESGETSELALPLVGGAPLELRLLADTAGPYQRPVLRLRDASGASIIEEELLPQRVGGYRVELALLPGVYHAEAWLAGGPHAEAELVVSAGANPEPLVLDLR